MSAWRAIWRGWCRGCQAVFGAWAWQPPQWASGLRARLGSVPPRTAVLGGVLLLAAGAGGVLGWRWYQAQPKPQTVAYSVTPPARTPLETDNPKPLPLSVRFAASVADLKLVGRDVSAGITLSPTLAGTWHFVDDRVLEFRVTGDWPVGQHYEVRLERALFGPAVRLDHDTFGFDSAPFTARLAQTQLYQDPVNPGIKNGVFDVEFSHPVDPAEFEPRVELRLRGQQAGVLGVGRETTPFSVVYDKLKLHASVHSATLPIPAEPTEIGFTLKAGTRAARGGNRVAEPLAGAVPVPGLYSLATLGVEPLVVNNARDEPEQVLAVTLSATAGEHDVARAVKAWLLPVTRPAEGASPARGSEQRPYAWPGAQQVSPAVRAAAPVLDLLPVAAEREFVEAHSFRYHAEVGRYLLVQVQKNLRSFGGYLSARDDYFVVRVPPYPPQLSILSQGAILSLSGERKVATLVRDLPGIQVDIGRLLPAQLQHLVSQSNGDFAHPQFYGGLGEDDLVERFRQKVPLPGLKHGETHHEPIDLSSYLKPAGGERRGVFLLSVHGYDPKLEERQRRERDQRAARAREPGAADRSDAEPENDGGQANAEEDTGSGELPDLSDQRLVVVTDLGLLLKRSPDGSQDVFVQSIATGQPVAGARVEFIARNGSSLVSQQSNEQGRAHFAPLQGMVRERTPLLVQVTQGSDLSFLPLNRADRTLDLSRFDVGGIRNARTDNEISAYLFSDRGLYRPGETLHVGMIAKAADWTRNISGLPLEAEVIDARGLVVKRDKLRLPAGGFMELTCDTAATAPTGSYTVNLYIARKDGGGLIGSTTLRVQEFEPDRMKMAVRLSMQNPDGWVTPKELKAAVNVQNLFGTPAENRRVEATLTLTPAYPAFRRWPDYRFYDPQRAKDGYSDALKATTTDQHGDATIDLGLAKYANATYRLSLLARAFEPQGGRSVTGEVSTLVSEQPYLVGYKADGGLDYLPRDSVRRVALIAIDPAAAKVGVQGLKLVQVETQYVSVLTRQPNGTYKYESRRKDVPVTERPLALAAGGEMLTLDTATPGTFAYLVRNEAGLELNRIEYTVAGAGNLSRSLERNAELEIRLDKKDYAPGEDIELSIKAPYAGAGLITLERDHVYATQWFKSTTNASVQHIRVPADFEGNGYVSVQFVRDLGSDEIFTSPLSYGVAPFVTRLASRVNALTLSAPALVKPGTALKIHLAAAHATRAVVFAVDEGILEVAHYKAPDPLGEFFKKRALEVRTSQILDLILPEFKRLMASAAPGGDAEAALRRNLNPFKRKRATPAVYWSGLVDVAHERDFDWTVPDSFNGRLQLFAVSVDEASVGVARAETTVRADFVLTPNMPVAVSPGDEFAVSVGVANSLPDTGSGAEITVQAKLPPNLEPVGEVRRTVKIDALREGVVQFRVRAREVLGSAPISFEASWNGHQSRLVETVSVRPATPYLTEIAAGHFGAAQDVPVTRELYPDFRKLKVNVSSVPLALAPTLATYLNDYPHLCTEQLVSRGFPQLVLKRHAELKDPDAPGSKPGEATAALVKILRERQNDEGGFALWAASVSTDEFASVYAVHWLLEAREQGEAVPDDLLQKSLVWLQQYAASPVPAKGPELYADDLWMLRNRAYAAYLLTRQGAVTTPIAGSLRQALEARHPKIWQHDLAAGWLAAIYQLQKQDREAARLIEPLAAQLGHANPDAFAGYYDDNVRDQSVLYLLARHFPARLPDLNAHALEALVEPLSRGYYNTLSSARLLLALDAYAAAVPNAAVNRFSVTERLADGSDRALELGGSLVLQGRYSSEARRLHLANDSGLPGFYATSASGFDRAVPTPPLAQGMEVFREYLDAAGKPVAQVRTGDEVLVRVRARAVNRAYIDNVAVIDLLPGGFEPVLVAPSPADATAAGSRWYNRLGNLGNWSVQYADVRDDRVVLYGALTADLVEYSYRIRATNAGRFRVAPSIAQSMYDRQLLARSAPGTLTVVPPEAP